ncbi:MAG: CRISPR-associated endonuclease Cas1 [Desulfuromusa sp.]|nr:CRISPR-associated endonuclease Cas1 [Desulfuromusa sp.]
MIVYITTQGAKIVKEGRHLLVKKDGATHRTLFTYKLQQLIICGRIELTQPALAFLLREQIDTVFLRFDGRYLGRLSSAESKNVFLRKKQFLLLDDQEFCLRVARQLLRGKFLNMITVLQRIGRTRKNRSVDPCIQQIRNSLHNLEAAASIGVLMGYEGSATAAYFSGFRLGLDRDFGFTRRVRRPPTDPVNSVLSLLYTMLINRVYAAIRIAGLDPYPGVLHQSDYGRQALPLDLVEEFRAILADTLTLSLFNLRVLQDDDFERVLPEPVVAEPLVMDTSDTSLVAALNDPLGRMNCCDAESVFDIPSQQTLSHEETAATGNKLSIKLSPAAFRQVLTAFERKLATEFFHPLAEKRISYADALVFQARQYRRVVEGEIVEYQPLLLK